MKKLTAFFALPALLLTAWAQGSSTGNPQHGATATPIEEDEGIVETVRLGGEENTPDAAEGVEQAESYEQAANPDSPLSVTLDIASQENKQAPAKPIVTDTIADTPPIHDPSREAYAVTRKNSRTLSMTVPGPRGCITDRNGQIMASSEVAYQPSIDFGQLEKDDDSSILSLARKVIAEYEKQGLRVSEKTDDQLLSHYRNRRWLPLPIGPVVREKEINKKRKALENIKHGKLMPLYIRQYPAKTTACHIVGYTGAKAKLPTGPINHNDPIFEKQEGRFGLEQKFNKQLTGQPGIWRLMFDENGKKILDELQVKPRPGGTVVTTINLDWQRAAEEALARNTLGRGAFVMIDIHTGEVVVLASMPNFDPNTFIPSISQKDYDTLRNDNNTPLVSRAFAGVYPPASTFKTITIAAALRYHVITEDTYVNCPSSIRIGGHNFKNHSKFSGTINCVTALVLSNNPFMYQVVATREPKVGAERLCEIARRFGYGSPTGLPLADKAGNVPDEAWMFRNYGRGFMAGDGANMSIGQGPILATPLQVAHAISGIANGTYLPKLQLIRQMLDADGNVVYQFTPSAQSNLKDLAPALAVVRKGMRAVVNGGTGRRASLSYVSNAGKTGTAQWGKPSDDCRLAWFAGFIPADEPRFAYAALYEGKPHQVISGSRMATAIVKSFFENEKVKAGVKAALEEPTRNLDSEVEDEAEEVTDDEENAAEAEARARAAAEAQREAEEARRRNSQSGWDDGRSRH